MNIDFDGLPITTRKASSNNDYSMHVLLGFAEMVTIKRMKMLIKITINVSAP